MRSQLLGLLVFLAISALGTVLPAESVGSSGGPSYEGSGRCIKPLVRKEWSVPLVISDFFALAADHSQEDFIEKGEEILHLRHPLSRQQAKRHPKRYRTRSRFIV